VGNVGAESRLSFRMVGEAMNKAHRLVELAEDGQIVISKSLYLALAQSAPALVNRIKFTQIGPVKLKGILQPQLLYAAQVDRPPLKK
jgi:class 3 adenylate cyclase